MNSAPLRILVQNPVQVADYAPGAAYGPRLLPSFELVWLLRGSARLRTESVGRDGAPPDTRTSLLRPGMIALTRRGDRDCYLWDSEQVSRHAYVHFELLQTGHLGDPSGWPSVRTWAEMPVLEGLCAYLLELAGQGSGLSKRRSDQIVELVLDLFVSGPFPGDRDQLPVAVRRMSDHVSRLWCETGLRLVPVAELAAAAHVSVGYLHRTFRRRYGCGPARALELVRLARAATALQRSNATISEIAGRCGYRNPYHFSRRFAHTYGAPPDNFRRQQPLTDPLWPVRDAHLLSVARSLLGGVDG